MGRDAARAPVARVRIPCMAGAGTTYRGAPGPTCRSPSARMPAPRAPDGPPPLTRLPQYRKKPIPHRLALRGDEHRGPAGRGHRIRRVKARLTPERYKGGHIVQTAVEPLQTRGRNRRRGGASMGRASTACTSTASTSTPVASAASSTRAAGSSSAASIASGSRVPLALQSLTPKSRSSARKRRSTRRRHPLPSGRTPSTSAACASPTAETRADAARRLGRRIRVWTHRSRPRPERA